MAGYPAKPDIRNNTTLMFRQRFRKGNFISREDGAHKPSLKVISHYLDKGSARKTLSLARMEDGNQQSRYISNSLSMCLSVA